MEKIPLNLKIEALVFASEVPLSVETLHHLLNQAEGAALVEEADIVAALQAIGAKYAASDYPFELKESGGGYQFLTKKSLHGVVVQLNGDKYTKKLSAAAMETLSIIAYRQPVTKMDIELIRGVSADYSIQKLLEKELIVIAGRKEDAIGKPLLYETSRQFLDYLGISGPGQLPQLKEIVVAEQSEPQPAETALPELKPVDENSATGAGG